MNDTNGPGEIKGGPRHSAPRPPADIEQMKPYVSARQLNSFDPQGVFIDANELPYSFPFKSIKGDWLNHYADGIRINLEEQFADYAGVSQTQVIASRGIDEAIDLLIRAYCEPRRDMVFAITPTYGAYEVAAAIHRCEFASRSISNDLVFDVSELRKLETTPRIVFYCRPNNPTGHLSEISELKNLVQTVPAETIIAVDEAYIEFSIDSSCVGLLSEFPNLVVLRTMSKAFGLAGIHTGYCLGSEGVIATLKKISNPYPIPDPCAQIALAALSDVGLATLRENVKVVNDTRAVFVGKVATLQCTKQILPSSTNFVTGQFNDADAIVERLKQRRIYIRPLPAMLGESGWLRFSIGDAKQMQVVIDILSSC